MTQDHVLASEGRQRYTLYTKTPKNIKEKKNNVVVVSDTRDRGQPACCEEPKK
jgi:hypothetical protein